VKSERLGNRRQERQWHHLRWMLVYMATKRTEQYPGYRRTIPQSQASTRNTGVLNVVLIYELERSDRLSRLDHTFITAARLSSKYNLQHLDPRHSPLPFHSSGAIF
jgi:hypothetical protein